ncbi:MAG: sugar phosphate nucleotidyltransferase [Candidatus Thermoplasmatota archaeon]|jgi:UTP--glucose-1-phosphate uridylyltransferase|nr:sugar phosphate nucleotidyltransferase [Candidatus Thermoplasmatota archaeon]MCL5789180.1 sugar phosphate nucleotidyltransferase [Candidatus Thermoplasmatota archaeon]
MSRIRKVVIPAAGTGSRFYPLTRAQPKEMLPILDKPVIHYVVEEAINSGLDEILIIVGAGKDAIINYFDKHSLDQKMDNYGLRDLPPIFFVRQREQRGLADALKYAEHFTGDDDFVVLLGDTIYKSKDNKTVTSKILSAYERFHHPLLAVEKVSKEKIKDYGIIDGEKIEKGIYKVKGVVEKPDPSKSPSNLGITGIYVLGSYFYDYLKMIKPGVNGEFQLADAYNLLVKGMEVIAAEIEGTRYDIGTKELWFNTFIEFSKNLSGNRTSK